MQRSLKNTFMLFMIIIILTHCLFLVAPKTKEHHRHHNHPQTTELVAGDSLYDIKYETILLGELIALGAIAGVLVITQFNRIGMRESLRNRRNCYIYCFTVIDVPLILFILYYYLF